MSAKDFMKYGTADSTDDSGQHGHGRNRNGGIKARGGLPSHT